MTVQTLEARRNYQIVELKEIETAYGKSYVLTDSNLDEYWSNKKVVDYIKKNKIPLFNEGKVLFTIKTGDYKTFKTEEGKEVRFLNLLVSK